MEALQGYLMEDELEYYLSSSPDAGLKYSESSSLDEWWDFQIPENDNIHDLIFDFTPNQEEQFQGYSNNIAASSYPGGVPCHHEQQELRQYCRDVEQYSCREQEEQLEEEDDFFFNGNDDEEQEVESDDLRKLSSCSSSKNLISERNRRKRLNQQLFTLRSLVPNITKMDKRSILVDALAHLQGILQETEALMKTSNFDSDITITREASQEPVIHDHQDEPAPVLESHHDLQPREYCIRPPIPTLMQVDAEMLDTDRFILKITCNRAIGAPGQVQKVIESLGLEITLVSIGELGQDYSLAMAFLRAKKKGVVTVEKLKHRVKVMAKRMSFRICNMP